MSIETLPDLERLSAPMGGSVGYRTMGDGDWLVLIHGWCGNADIWSPIVPALAGGYRILAVTLPGFGGMAPPPKDGQTMGAMGAAVAHVLAHLGIDRAVLVGHSMGGPVMTEAAICAPERIRALVGLDTLTDRHYYGRVPDAEIARRHAEFAADYTGRMRGMIDDIVHPGTPETLRQSITDDMVMAAPMEFALDIKDWLLAWNAEERWPLVNCPALMLNSTWSARRAHPESMACFAATAVVPYDSGHFPMIEAPGMIVEKLKTCLAGLVCRHARD